MLSERLVLVASEHWGPIPGSRGCGEGCYEGLDLELKLGELGLVVGGRWSSDVVDSMVASGVGGCQEVRGLCPIF
jgi:hypothetical protein